MAIDPIISKMDDTTEGGAIHEAEASEQVSHSS